MSFFSNVNVRSNINSAEVNGEPPQTFLARREQRNAQSDEKAGLNRNRKSSQIIHGYGHPKEWQVTTNPTHMIPDTKVPQ